MAATNKKKNSGPRDYKKVFLCRETFCDKLDALISYNGLVYKGNFFKILKGICIYLYIIQTPPI